MNQLNKWMLRVFLGIILLTVPFLAGLCETDEAVLQAQYEEAVALLENQDYKEAQEAFEALGDFSDSKSLANESYWKWLSAEYRRGLSLYNNESYEEAAVIFETLGKYEQSTTYLGKCEMELLRQDYYAARELVKAGAYEEAVAMFEALDGFSDSDERAEDARAVLAEQAALEAEKMAYEQGLSLKASGDLRGAIEAFIESGDYSDGTEQIYDMVLILDMQTIYEQAQTAKDEKEYETAYWLFTELGDFENSALLAVDMDEAIKSTRYETALSLKQQDPCMAYILFASINGYEDSQMQADQLLETIDQETLYEVTDVLAQAGDFKNAALGFEALAGYEDSEQRMEEAILNAQRSDDYNHALYLRQIRQEEEANAIFASLGTFQNADEMIMPITMTFSAKQLRDDNTTPQSAIFTAEDGSQHVYQIFKGVHTWVEAKAFCEVLGGHLATITSEEENQFVHGFMIDSGFFTAYFGLSDEKRVGDWIWVTGEPFVYSNWDSGEPSRSANERYGMYFYKHLQGTWNDSHFYENDEVDPGCSYICEWELPLS